MTPRAKELKIKLEVIDSVIANGQTPFVAMSTMLTDEDWLLVYVAFKTLVAEANK